MNIILAQNLLHDLTNVAEDVRNDMNESYKPRWQRIPDYIDEKINDSFSNTKKVKIKINNNFTYDGYIGIMNEKMHYSLFQSILLKVLNSLLEPFNVINTRIYGLDVFVNFKNKDSLFNAVNLIRDSTPRIPIAVDEERKKMKLSIGNHRLTYFNQIEKRPIKEDEEDRK